MKLFAKPVLKKLALVGSGEYLEKDPAVLHQKITKLDAENEQDDVPGDGVFGRFYW